MFENKYNLKFGTDPEVFAGYDGAPTDVHLAGLPFAASPGVLGRDYGFKHIGGPDKHPVYIKTNDGAVIGDGVAFEINLDTPCDSPREMWDRVNTHLTILQARIKELGFFLHMKPLVNFDYEKYWVESLEDDPILYWSTIFGCDPDQDAFDVNWLCQILDNSKHPFRYGGGHIHISGDVDIEKYPLIFVKMLALTLGNYTTSISPFNDLELMRAKYYGKPGKHRVQHYKNGTSGVEYRTPPNSWLSFTYPQYERMFDMINHALYLVKHPKDGKLALSKWSLDTVEAITTANKDLSAKVLAEMSI